MKPVVVYCVSRVVRIINVSCSDLWNIMCGVSEVWSSLVF